MNTELEKAISDLEMYRNNYSNFEEELAESIDIVLAELEDSISKDKLEKILIALIEEFDKTTELYTNTEDVKEKEKLKLEATVISGGITTLEKILELEE